MLGLVKKCYGEFKRSGFQPTGKLTPVSPYFKRQRQNPIIMDNDEGEPNWYIREVPRKVDMNKPDFTSYPVGDRNERERLFG
jgi:hypothetical protein